MKIKVNKKLARKVSRYAGKVALTLRKHLPDILIGLGIVGGGATVVTACVETAKTDPILDEAKDQVEDIHAMVTEANDGEERSLAIKDSKKELAKVYCHTGMKLFVHYFPSIALGSLSVACILSGHNIMRKRNVALAAAYTAVNKTLVDYRERVRNKLGEEEESDLFNNTTTKTIIDSETGEVTKETVANEGRNPYEILFAPETSKFWSPDPNYNKMLFENVQQYGTDLYSAKGHVFENDILEELAMHPTVEGQVIGWCENMENSDGYIDLRAKEVRRINADGNPETVFILNPNFDGTILYTFAKGLNN